MDLRDYIRILHKNWILIVASVLAGVGVASVFSIASTPRYDATSQLYVSVSFTADAGSGELAQGTSFARQAVTSYVSIARSSRVLQPVVDELGLPVSAAQLASQVTASSPANTVLIEVSASDTDPQRAADIANAVGRSLANIVVNELERPEGESLSPVNISPVQEAVAASRPSSPNAPLNIALGMLLGLAVGTGITALRTVLDTRIHSTHDIAQVTDAPIIGRINYDPEAKKRPLVVHVDPRNPRAEAFRALRTNLQFLNVEGGPRSFVVTSSIPGEGKSTTACNLAISLADTGARVALVDGDLRLPRVAHYMGIEGGVGLTDVLIGRAELSDVIQRWGRAALYVLPSGRIPPNPSELLGSTAMVSLLATLTAEFDYVIIDAPPLLLVTDAAVISKFTGGAMLTAASGRTKKAEISGSSSVLESIGSRLVGVIVTMLPSKGPDSYGYGVYGYGDISSVEPDTTRRTKTRRAAVMEQP
ncbi:polysaccharide biosynthesis tyrosine autokinase [Yonghaparkia sp. Root332]|uniref:polysaccharide biosynthesis tyrosine autokinase n=1 Tax=Yonghaparkia sp. Root332 TaxID=1736516 RepID=UPI0007015C27|nr:polysaccharide biosynthesis tyrosine autokinase [Yonghaparkia sp. Root332]KQV25462.1 chromosome partitioning protein [Yonghaparkia sp. Root332]